MAWYIDSIDARAGLAFASERKADLSDAEQLLDTSLAAFVAAPDFRPQLGVSRTTAFAVARGSFQLGLFINDEKEVAFPSLPAVAEFVRRAYLRSSGGDDPGTDPTPSPDIDGPKIDGELEEKTQPSDSEGVDFVAVLKNERKRFHSESGILGTEESAKKFVWNMLDDSSQKVEPNVHRAVIGGYRVLHELLRRCPRAGDLENARKWCEASRRLCHCFDQLGLWPFISHTIKTFSCEKQIRTLAKFLSAEQFLSHLRHMLDEQPANWAETIFLRELLVNGHRLQYLEPLWPYVCWPACALTDGIAHGFDPVDNLSYLPIPQDIETTIWGKTKPSDRMNLCHLFSSLSGCPNQEEWTEPALEVLLFISAYLVSPAYCAQRSNATRFWHVSEFTDVQPVMVTATEQVVKGAIDWLSDCLPKFAFSEDIESLISSAIELRYSSQN